MPTLAVDNFNIVCATLGGFILLFGLVSYLAKEKFYLSEALISTIAGIIFSPHAANLIRPLEYALGDQDTLVLITLYFSRLVLGVQLVLAGVQLPSKYLQKQWKSLALLLGPGMCTMWTVTSLLVWAFVPNLNFVYALAIGACVTPTDPILSNNIVKGKFADKNIPVDLQRLVIAESGANDGLGYPFLFLPLYLIKYVMHGGVGHGNGGTAIGMWFYETWVYEIFLGVIYGAIVGWIGKELLHWAESRKYVDRESFLVFAVALALFIVGTCGMIGTDDVLACFIAGNTFTWDDWFRVETKDDSLQPTIDMLLNVSIFIWYGAVCPWRSFAENDVIPIYRLIFLGILVLLLRRPPIVFAMHTRIHQIEEWRQALFVGFFGPIGVSAIFYLQLTLQYVRANIVVDGVEREDARRFEQTIEVVVWFMVVCSIIVHGLSVPLGKVGWHVQSWSRSVSEANDQPSFNLRDVVAMDGSNSDTSDNDHYQMQAPRVVHRIGRSIAHPRTSQGRSSKANTPRPGSRNSAVSNDRASSEFKQHQNSDKQPPGGPEAGAPEGVPNRVIRFHDDHSRGPDNAESDSGQGPEKESESSLEKEQAQEKDSESG